MRQGLRDLHREVQREIRWDATMKNRLKCIECRKRLSNEHEAGWQAYLVGDPDTEGEEEEIVIYCPACARREFGPFASEAS